MTETADDGQTIAGLRPDYFTAAFPRKSPGPAAGTARASRRTVADSSRAKCAAFGECAKCTRPFVGMPPAPFGSAVAAAATRAAGESDRYPLQATWSTARTHRHMRTYRIESAQYAVIRSRRRLHRAHDRPAPRGRTCRATASAKHSALVSRPRRGRWMQTMHTELSLDANEALSLASMVRQSCPTARLRGATRIQNRKLWREYGRRPFGLRLASMARSKGCCLRVQLRALSGNACAAHERWGRGERDAAVPRHGRDKAAGARRAPGGRGAVGCSSARREGRMCEVQARVSLAHRLRARLPVCRRLRD